MRLNGQNGLGCASSTIVGGGLIPWASVDCTGWQYSITPGCWGQSQDEWNAECGAAANPAGTLLGDLPLLLIAGVAAAFFFLRNK